MKIQITVLTFFIASILITSAIYAQKGNGNGNNGGGASCVTPTLGMMTALIALPPTQVGQIVTYINSNQVTRVGTMITGYTYKISNCNISTQDTEMFLRELKSNIVIECGDDECGKQSEINFTPAVDGDYLIQVLLAGSYTHGGVTNPTFEIELVSNGTVNGNGNGGGNSGQGGQPDQTVDVWVDNGNDVVTPSSFTGNVGIGTQTPSATLDVNGTFKLTDGKEGINKVLTSDANGNASWQTPSNSNTHTALYATEFLKVGTNSTYLTGNGSLGTPGSGNAIFSDGAALQINPTGVLADDGINPPVTSTGLNTIINGGSGKVGIGTNNPQYKFHVFGVSALTGQFKLYNQEGDVYLGTQQSHHHLYSTDIPLRINGLEPNNSGSVQNTLINTHSGVVGIGTTSPQHKLHLVGDLGVEGDSYFSNGHVNLVSGKLNIEGGTGNPQIRIDASNGDTYFRHGNFGIGTYTPQYQLHVVGDLGVQGNANFTNGNVGIGIYNPQAQLHVVGDVRINAGIIDIRSNSGDHQIRIDGSNGDTYFRNGNFAIGTYNPQHKLHVVGDLGIQGNSYLLGSVGIGTTIPLAEMHLQNGRAIFENENNQIRLYDTDDGPVSGQVFTQIERNGGKFNIYQYTGGGANQLAMAIAENGNVGIGTALPSAKIHAESSDNQACLILDQLSGNSYQVVQRINVTNDLMKPLQIRNNGVEVFAIWGNGIMNTQKIYATEIQVQPNTANISWPDYVFEKDYDLSSLKEVSEYISEHRHLPGVPSANDIDADGVNLVDMDAILLQKIEELTLYILEQEKRINVLENR